MAGVTRHRSSRSSAAKAPSPTQRQDSNKASRGRKTLVATQLLMASALLFVGIAFVLRNPEGGLKHLDEREAADDTTATVNAIETIIDSGTDVKYDPTSSDFNALAWLLGKENWKAWMTDQWDSKPTLIKRETPSIYDPLLVGPKQIHSILTVQRKTERMPLLMHPTSGASQADCSTVYQGMDNQTEKFKSIHQAYLNGATIVCNIVPSYWGPLALLMEGLANSTGLQFMANMYLTPRNSQGFTAHTDNKDGLVIQVSGKKRWVVHESKFSRPLRSQMLGRPHETPVDGFRGRLVFDDFVNEGDLIHLPRGYIHFAAASEEHSLHYTISATKNLEWADFLLDYITAFVDDTKSPVIRILLAKLWEETQKPGNGWLRKSLPFNYTNDRPSLRIGLQDMLSRVQRTMEKRVGKVAGLTNKEVKTQLGQIWDKLQDGYGQDSAIDIVLKKNGVYSNYVKSLVKNGVAIYDAKDSYLDGSIQETSSFFVVAGGHAELRDGLQSAAKDSTTSRVALFTGNTVEIRWSDEVYSIVNGILSFAEEDTFKLENLPGSDDFEKACIVQLCIDHGVLKQATA